MRHYIVVTFFCILSNILYARQQETTTKETKQDIPEDSLWNWQLNEVSVTARRQPKTITGLLSGKLELNMDGLKTLPKFLGTADPLRTMQLMPGVQTTGELNSGIYIRGADPGHNQILLNGAPIYNPMHLLGFFSIFNGNHLDKFSLIKSGISPE